jgi:hypothetical protein
MAKSQVGSSCQSKSSTAERLTIMVLTVLTTLLQAVVGQIASHGNFYFNISDGYQR